MNIIENIIVSLDRFSNPESVIGTCSAHACILECQPPRLIEGGEGDKAYSFVGLSIKAGVVGGAQSAFVSIPVGDMDQAKIEYERIKAMVESAAPKFVRLEGMEVSAKVKQTDFGGQFKWKLSVGATGVEEEDLSDELTFNG